MTKRTLSRSAKATTLDTDLPDEADESGPLATDPSSESISRYKRWTVVIDDGSMYNIITNGDGRISFTKGTRSDGGELRIYRSATTKVYDALLTGVVSVVSDECAVQIQRRGSTKGGVVVRPLLTTDPPPEAEAPDLSSIPRHLLSPMEQDELDELGA